MPSPFPGMDPFIEGQDWEDFHQGFIVELAAALVPLVRPRYVVRRERRVYVEHQFSGQERLIRSDVAVLADRSEDARGDAASTSAGLSPVLVSLPMPEEHREAFLTIRERESMDIVTLIEVLSPGNKRAGRDGRNEYLRKREDVLASHSHLVEIDLLRGGQRLPATEPLPSGDYYAFVCRQERRYKAEVYAWPLRHRLPQIPIPLAHADPDAWIDLQQIFNSTYERAGYDYSLDYQRHVEPPLAEADSAWAAELSRRSGG
jgi:hypothetical protein